MRWGRRIGYGLAAGFLLAQLVRVERTNPPVEAEIVAEPEVHALLRRACYDCHSHATVWPWYAWVAPVSWLVAHDVNHARGELDFSRFESYDAKKQRKKLGELVEEVEEHEMPLWYYVLLHPDADLSDSERARLVSWAGADRARRGRPRAPATP
jgi:Haem-binding domain